VHELVNGRLSSRLEFSRARRNTEIGPMSVHESEHESVAADEDVAGHPVAFQAKNRRDANRGAHLWHVARLAAPRLTRERAVSPLLVVHLLGQCPDNLGAGTLRQLRRRRLDILEPIVEPSRSHLNRPS
jgi:hypothetical protein